MTGIPSEQYRRVIREHNGMEVISTDGWCGRCECEPEWNPRKTDAAFPLKETEISGRPLWGWRKIKKERNKITKSHKTVTDSYSALWFPWRQAPCAHAHWFCHLLINYLTVRTCSVLLFFAKSYHVFGDATSLWFCVSCFWSCSGFFVSGLCMQPFWDCLQVRCRVLVWCLILLAGMVTHACLDISFNLVSTFLSWMVSVSPSVLELWSCQRRWDRNSTGLPHTSAVTHGFMESLRNFLWRSDADDWQRKWCGAFLVRLSSGGKIWALTFFFFHFM